MKKIPFLKLRVTAIFMLAAGYGWAGGHFIPSDSSMVAYLFQVVVLSVLLIFSLSFFTISYQTGHSKSNRAIIGLNIFTTLSFLMNIGNIIQGTMKNNTDSFGSHNTFADLVPISILIAGNLIWLITALLKKNFDKQLINNHRIVSHPSA
ncbi:MAG: hypothetical protein ACR2FN_01175 [Chitinophagaceae bacterium]